MRLAVIHFGSVGTRWLHDPLELAIVRIDEHCSLIAFRSLVGLGEGELVLIYLQMRGVLVD
jgi:hypothetical protein